jgi:PAS domain S-box-containing protein
VSELHDRVPILLVDDRPEDLLALTSILDGPGYELVTARSGADALRRALAQDFAVIVLDVVMPEVDGFEVATLLRRRARSQHTPIIFLTGADADTASIYRGYSIGAVDYLVKPVGADVLRAKLATFVDLFRKDARIRAQADALLAAERRTRELELAEAERRGERRYRNLADAIPEIVWTSDPSGALTHVNRRYYAYTGMAPETLPATWLDHVHPDDRDGCEVRWREALRAGSMFEGECRLRAIDGVYRAHLCRAVPERGPGGGIVGWIGAHTDLDDLVRARAQTEAARQRSELLAEASLVLGTSLDLTVALARVADLIVSELADACLIDAVDPGDPAAGEDGARWREPLVVGHRDPARIAGLEDAWRPAADRGPPARGARAELLRVLDRDALEALAGDPARCERLHVFGFRAAITVPIAAAGRTLGAITCFATTRRWDIDDLGMLEDLGRRAGAATLNALLYARAERAVRARDEFLSVASHELRTPLSALMLQLGGLERVLADAGERTARKVGASLRHTERLARLIDSLLDVSRLATGRLSLSLEDCDLGELVREVVERMSEGAQRAGCELVVLAAPRVRGRWDRLRIDQVVTNLISNGVKYGAGQPIEIEVGGDGDAAVVVVRDHGIGIAADDLVRIFDRFERAAPARHYGGLGLGLFIAREILRAHGGDIAAASTPDAGTVFTVRLPRQPPAIDDDTAPPEAPQPEAP